MEEKSIPEIHININNVMQLFSNLDPSPFWERDLDPAAADYIKESVKEHPVQQRMKLVIFLPKKELKKTSTEMIEQSIRNYFHYEVEVLQTKLKNLFLEGRWAFVSGISFLVICLSLNYIVSHFLYGIIADVAAEGLYIGGWVAMWKPISIFLYDWWPIENERRVFDKIKTMEIEIKSS